MWSSVLLSLTKPASHRCDERCPFPAAVLRQQEGHVAVGCQVFDCLVHDPREAVKGNKGKEVPAVTVEWSTATEAFALHPLSFQ